MHVDYLNAYETNTKLFSTSLGGLFCNHRSYIREKRKHVRQYFLKSWKTLEF